MSVARAQPIRVLVLAKREPWPLSSGGTLRLYHLLDGLGRAAEVTLALQYGPQHRSHLPARWRVKTIEAEAGTWCRHTSRAPAGLAAYLARRHFGYDYRIAGWLHRNARLERFNVALLYGAVLGVYAEDVGLPVVWDPTDDLVLYTIRAAEQRGPQAWPTAARMATLYALYQRYVGRHARATLFCSPIDASYARRWMGSARIELVRNGVDTEYYAPCARAPETGTVVFIGTLSFPPNVDGIIHFATHAWPGIHASDPNRRLLVVGKTPVAAVRALGTRPGVEVVGEVPDVRPYMARAAVVVVPTRSGGGIKNKVLQACAMGRPVVASPRAIAGLTVRPGVEIMCATRPATWGQQVSRLLDQPAHAQAVGRAGYQWVCRAHRWPDSARRLREILESVCLRDAVGRPRRSLPADDPPHPARSGAVSAPDHVVASSFCEEAPCR